MFRSKIFTGSMVVATSLSAFFLTSAAVSADTETRTARIQVSSACTMDGSVTSAHTANVNAGSYTENIGSTVFSVVCNDSAGFGVYAIGYTDNEDGNAVMQGTGNNTIATGTATSGNTSNWAMKLSTVEGTVAPTILNNYDNYNIVPSADYVKVASYPNATSASSSAVFKTSYAAYVTLTQPADTYTGQVKYVLVHPANGEAPVPVAQMFNNAFAAADNTKYRGYYKMQDMTPAICDAVTTPTAASNNDTPEIQLIDIRDNKVYWVSKLKDGKCWMTQNLDLDLVHVANDANARYNHDNTDIGWGSDTTTMSWNPANSISTVYDIVEDDNGEGPGFRISTWVNDEYHPYSFDPGDWYWTDTWYESYRADYYYVGDHAWDPPKFQEYTPFSGNGAHGHVGNLYNWSAAIANNDTSNVTNSPQNSVCPKGWRLPTVYGDSVDPRNEFAYLFDKYGADGTSSDARMVTESPLWFVRNGEIEAVWSNSLEYSGIYGLYLAKEFSGSSEAVGMFFGSDSVLSATSFSRKAGISIRCVAR